MPKRKRKIGPGERFDPKIHIERRVGPKDRRKFQQRPVVGGSGGWFGSTGPHYERRDASSKTKYSPGQRQGPKDRRKKKE